MRPGIDDMFDSFFEGRIFLGPQHVKNLNFRLTLHEAEELSKRFNDLGYDVQPYDFPGTLGIRLADDGRMPYRCIIIKKAVLAIAGQEGINIKGEVGFEEMKALLPYLSRDRLQGTVISRWGTTCQGALKYHCRSPSAAVLELVEKDKDFSLFRQDGAYPLRAYDFTIGPQNLWKDCEGINTKEALDAAKDHMINRATVSGIDLFTNGRYAGYVLPEKFSQALPLYTASFFRNEPINEWGTRLECVLKNNENSPRLLVDRVVKAYPEFCEVANNFEIAYYGKTLVLKQL